MVSQSLLYNRRPYVFKVYRVNMRYIMPHIVTHFWGLDDATFVTSSYFFFFFCIIFSSLFLARGIHKSHRPLTQREDETPRFREIARDSRREKTPTVITVYFSEYFRSNMECVPLRSYVCSGKCHKVYYVIPL